MAGYKLFIISIFICVISFGQTDTLNQTDDEGLKQGYWIITGKMYPEKKYCDTCKIEEGTYLNDRKHGVWRKYHIDGKTIRMQAIYQNGRPNGRYMKGGLGGFISEEGSYSSTTKLHSYRRYNEHGALLVVQDFDSTNSGVLRYYYDNCISTDTTGRIEMEFYRKNGYSCDTAFAYYYSGCIQKMSIYDTTGQLEATLQFKNDCDVKNGIFVGSGGIDKKTKPCDPIFDPHNPPRPPSRIYDPNGYNKLYDKNDNLWMDGYFKGGKLWNGKHYRYDSDGILFKIEVWKEGEYNRDDGDPNEIDY